MTSASLRVSEFVRECQWFAGKSSLAADRHAQISLVREFIARLPDPADRLAALTVRAILIEVALKWAGHVHRRARSTRPLQCQFPAPEDLRAYWNEDPVCYKSLFERWAVAFVEDFDRAYPICPAARAKEIIDERCADPLRLKSLARMTGCTVVRLRTLFREEFGISLREYRTRARVMNAAKLIAGSDVKIEAVAAVAGFRSRRNFYSAFRRIMGCAPSEKRRHRAQVGRTTLPHA